MAAKLTRLIFYLSICWSANLLAQVSSPTANFSNENLHLVEMNIIQASNIGSNDEGKEIIIKVDGYPDSVYSGLAWTVSSKTPKCFVSGKKLRVTALISGCSENMYAKGIGPDGFEAPPKKLVYDNLSQSWRYPATELNKKFNQFKVDFYDPFEITWYVSNSTANNAHWTEIPEKSSHPLLITHKKPIIGPAAPMHYWEFKTTEYYSILYLGCRGAKGKETPDSIVNSIYTNEMMGLNVKKVGNNSPISYWKVVENCWTIEDLLIKNNGTCGAWAFFFNDFIRLQGIEGSGVYEVKWKSNYRLNPSETDSLLSDVSSEFAGLDCYVSFKWEKGKGVGNNLPEAHFFIKNWDFSPFPNKKFYLIEAPANSITICPANSYFGSDMEGVPGQGGPNPNPRAYFDNHAVVKFAGKIYDVSYGSAPLSSQNEWENGALLGFGTIISVWFKVSNSPGAKVIFREFIWLKEINTEGDQQTLDFILAE